MSASPSRSTPARFLRSAPLLVAVVLAVLALTACDPASVLPGPSGSPSASESPTASGSPTPDPTPTGSSGTVVSPEMTQNLADAISSGNTAAVEGYLADPTRVVIAASEADGPQSPVDAVLSLDYVQPGVGFWDFQLDPQIVDTYAANPYYGEFFPDDVIVGRSDTGAVVAFVPSASDRIATIFMSIDESLIIDY
jgi:hypothetical protein